MASKPTPVLLTTVFIALCCTLLRCSVLVLADDASATSFKCPSNFGYFADPTNCASYYICTFGSAKPRQCGSDLVYHETTKTCDEKKPGVAGCGGNAKPNDTATTSAAVKPAATVPAETKTAKTSHDESTSKKPTSNDVGKPLPAEDDTQQAPSPGDKKPNPISTSSNKQQLPQSSDDTNDSPIPPQRKLNYVDNMPPPRRPASSADDVGSSRRPPPHHPLLNVGSTFRRQFASQSAARATHLPAKSTTRRPRPDLAANGDVVSNKLDEDLAPTHRSRGETVDSELAPQAPAPGPTGKPTAVHRPPPAHHDSGDRYIRPPPSRSSSRPGAPPPVPGRPPPHDLYQPNERRESQPLFPSYETINRNPDTPAEAAPVRKQTDVVAEQTKQQQQSPPPPAPPVTTKQREEFDYNRAADEQPAQPKSPQPDSVQQQPVTEFKPTRISALPPADKLSPALPQHPTKCDPAVNCFLPRCYCGDITVPANLQADQTPQMVVISFDGPVNERSLPVYEELFDNAITNPNGCPIRATFFISHEFTNYGMVRHLYEKGHGIGSYSISHGHGQGFRGVNRWRSELEGEKLFLAKFAAINPDYIKGARAPLFSCGGDDQFEAMEQGTLLFDSTMPVPANTRAPFWPYTLDHGMPHTCVIPPCPERPHPGVWELPLNPIYGLFGESCFSIDRCNFGSNTEQVFNIMYNNFYRNHYQTNRAPFHLALHADWLNYQPYKSGFVKFISALSSMPDVWFVKGSQVIDWMQQPVNSRDAVQFQAWQCSESAASSNGTATAAATNDYKPPCNVINACPLPYEKRLRYFYTCSACPRRFPWVDDAEQWIADRNKV